MKIFAPPYGILAILFLALSFLIVAPMKSQTIQIDSTFTTDAEIFPFENLELISELLIEGDVELSSDTSLVRVILEDENGFRYMVLEAYPLICPEIDFTVQDHCDETCALDMINPASVIIQIIDATLDLKSFSYETEAKENAETARYTAKRELDADKIESMNQRVADFGMNWTSGDNSIVASYYESKSAMFGEGYNLLGYDYYAGGIFEFLGHRNYPKVDPDMVWHFDWRDRHGANDPQSPYWDGDILGTGWLTSVKDQMDCGSCFAFSTIGTVEALANLYAVSVLDLDLSEQRILCQTGSCESGGYILTSLGYIKNYGVPLEEFFPYDTVNYDASGSCVMPLNPDTIVKINDAFSTSENFEKNFDSIRVTIINHGPITFSFDSLIINNDTLSSHAVVLCGYEFSPFDSTLIWLIKNSWGIAWGVNGFMKVKLDDFKQAVVVLPPVTINNDNITKNYHDFDNDGYYFWGIGDKPVSCDCPDIEDCDDNDPFLGGYDENYYCTCLLEMDTISHIISTDTTWADTTYVNFEVIIDSGACLTISGYTAFAPEVMILVNPGGKLILDRAYLTKACPDLWDGIEVRGSDTSQFYNEYFGIVEIRDSSIIEFARCAIANHCKRCSPAVNQSGGIILAEEAIFRDNETDILLAPFHHIYQGNEVPYVASFEKCRFLTTENLYDLTVPKAHVELKDIFGLIFYACEFENLTGLAFAPPSIRGKGISSIDGQFMIKALCNDLNAIPCLDITPCEFNQLEYGIKALNSISKKTIIIENSYFEDNLVGLSISGIDYVSVISNDFKCPTEYKFVPEDRFIGGLFLEGCTGYHIEDNFFHGDTGFFGSRSIGSGIAVKNSGDENNEIYNNSFNRLTNGIYVIGENRGRESGLCLKCNDMSGNTNDFIVVEDENPPYGSLQGIYQYQGDPIDSVSYDAPAGNIFSYFTGSADTINIEDFNYFNNGEDIWYFHHKVSEAFQVLPLPNNYTSETIQLIEREEINYSKDTACPSHLEGENNLKTFTSPHIIISEANEQIALLTEQLFALIDGGNTEGLNFEVMTSMPEDALEIRQELLNESPYLSDTVMKQAIYKENVLPNVMIRDILTVNPQSAKSEEVLDALDTRYEPMPDYMMGQIMEGQNILGTKELLEAQIQSWWIVRSKAKVELFRQYLSDTNLVSQADSIITFLEE
ncbi:MAG TPA: C1 family peptidase, partial [Bacteroidales bacterium]|nr:C1 family peptidase [Bacteroidales bacterium]